MRRVIVILRSLGCAEDPLIPSLQQVLVEILVYIGEVGCSSEDAPAQICAETILFGLEGLDGHVQRP